MTTSLPDLASALIRRHLTPDLLEEPYRSRWTPSNPTYGFCSVASEAGLFLLGGAPAGWQAVSGRDATGTHWWLKSSQGELLDITADQYYRVGAQPPYANARPGGFQGIRVDPHSPWGFCRRPSKRARVVLERIVAEAGVDTADTAAVAAWVTHWRQGRPSPEPSSRRRQRFR